MMRLRPTDACLDPRLVRKTLFPRSSVPMPLFPRSSAALHCPAFNPTPIDELRETRRRLNTEVGLDVERYAKMLGETGNKTPGTDVAGSVVSQMINSPPVGSS